ncbi:MAG: LemA family protein, partial [Peptoniphilaceae bacterium]|nr:LemA family protein [Peptoniphilaceae bacterium]MDY5765737.1 LemA family protein [Peptoniphilaceae bacterium]
ALTQIYAVAENYPDLKASSVYQTTMDSINRYEDNVRHSRMLYNDTVTKLNRTLQQFPTNIVAGMFGFRTMEYFQNSTEKAEMPQW